MRVLKSVLETRGLLLFYLGKPFSGVCYQDEDGDITGITRYLSGVLVGEEEVLREPFRRVNNNRLQMVEDEYESMWTLDGKTEFQGELFQFAENGILLEQESTDPELTGYRRKRWFPDGHPSEIQIENNKYTEYTHFKFWDDGILKSYSSPSLRVLLDKPGSLRSLRTKNLGVDLNPFAIQSVCSEILHLNGAGIELGRLLDELSGWEKLGKLNLKSTKATGQQIEQILETASLTNLYLNKNTHLTFAVTDKLRLKYPNCEFKHYTGLFCD